MSTVEEVLADLHARGTEKARVMYAKHGTPVEQAMGVSFADLKTIAKGLKGRQDLALQLYEAPFMEAKYLAGIIGRGDKMSPETLWAWAANSGSSTVAEYSVPWVTIEHPQGRELAVEWMSSTDESIASAGWATYSGLVTVTPDSELDLAEIEELLLRVVTSIDQAANRVRYCMNGFVIAVGTYVSPLAGPARLAAEQIGQVYVDMGKTACKVRLASEAIESAKSGAKRKTIRC